MRGSKVMRDIISVEGALAVVKSKLGGSRQEGSVVRLPK